MVRGCEAPLTVRVSARASTGRGSAGIRGVCISAGVSKSVLTLTEGIVSAKVSRAIASLEFSSVGGVVMDNRSSAPICSWKARMVLKIFRANHAAVARNAICTISVAISFQLLCAQEPNSLIIPPRTSPPNLQLLSAGRNWWEGQETVSYAFMPMGTVLTLAKRLSPYPVIAALTVAKLLS
jgi:hypothetical protein